MPSYEKSENFVNGQTPGVWNGGKGAAARFACPICGFANTLESYAVSAGGTVTPKFKCAAEGCAFTEDIILIGWGA